MNNGCEGLFQNTVIVVALIFMVILSIAGVSSMGLVGILVGPLAIAVGWILLGAIFS